METQEITNTQSDAPEVTTVPGTTPTEPASEATLSHDVINKEEAERLIAEAEQRGYLRGKNEMARQAMAQSRLLETPPFCIADPSQTQTDDTSFASRFLSCPPKSVW